MRTFSLLPLGSNSCFDSRSGVTHLCAWFDLVPEINVWVVLHVNDGSVWGECFRGEVRVIVRFSWIVGIIGCELFLAGKRFFWSH